MRRALVTGITGQDGCYLSRLLLEEGWEVYGARRRGASANTWRLQEEGLLYDIRFIDIDLIEPSNVQKVVEMLEPDAVYNLAAMSFVGTSFEQPVYTHHVNALGPIYLIEAIKSIGMECKIYQASTSEMYGGTLGAAGAEFTPMLPRSPYAIAKLAAYHSIKNFRQEGGFAVNGILFNHESKYRGVEFVTRKITSGLAHVKIDGADPVQLGNLEAERDWGHAKDYMYGAYLMMEHNEPDDWVLATGEKHSVREFFDTVAWSMGFEPEWSRDVLHEKCVDLATGDVIAEVNPGLWRPLEVDVLQGDATRARTVLNWTPKVSFDDLVQEMVTADLKRATDGIPIL